MRNNWLRVLTVMVTMAALLGGAASASLATIVERERYAFTDTFNDELCGIEVEIEEAVSGLFMIRRHHQGPAFLASDVFEYRVVITNPDNGKWVVERGKASFREVKATHVEGDVYRFRAHLAGHHYIIENSDGAVVYRDRGLLVFDVLFDTLGDDVPGGEFLGAELVERRGHPGFIDDLCGLTQELLG